MLAAIPTTPRGNFQSRASCGRFWRTIVAVAVVVGSADLAGAEPEPAPADAVGGAAWHVVPEPSFMQPEIEIAIPGSERTVLTPALIEGDTVTYLRRESLESLSGLDLPAIQRLARASASAELAQLEPRIIRDERGIIQFAIIDSDRPVVAATVLAPDFIEKFAATLGPDLLVAIPNRYRVYVFPALATRFEDLADPVLADYALTPYPVSKEIFRVLPEGTLRAIGTFEE